jgi:putative ABC transport system permease protein
MGDGGALGGLASLVMGFVRFSMKNLNSWSMVTFSFDPAPEFLLHAIVIAGLIGVLGGFFPAASAARISPIEAIRT